MTTPDARMTPTLESVDHLSAPAGLRDLLVEHSPTYDRRGYAVGCDACDLDCPPPAHVGDVAPLEAWADHIVTLTGEAGR